MSYTPSTDEVRHAVAGLHMGGVEFITHETFNRWLTGVKADAWDEGNRSAGVLLMSNPPQRKKNPYREEPGV